MRYLLLTVVLGGCSTMSLRAGAVMIGDRPAFQASVEVGPSFGRRRVYAITNEFGVQADDGGTSYVQALNVDAMEIDEEDGPIARIGVRARGAFRGDHEGDSSSALLMRGAFYTGILRDPATRSAGLGVELAGGMQLEPMEPIIEASIVVTGKWRID